MAKLYAGYGLKWPEAVDQDNTRFVMQSVWPVCLTGYAMSLRGASRALHRATRSENYGGAVDIALASWATEGALKAYTVVPPMFSPWGYRDGKGSSSDIHNPTIGKRDEHPPNHGQAVDGEDQIWQKGWNCIEDSALLGMSGLLWPEKVINGSET